MDGVCCGSACTDQCAACDVAGSAGTCTAVSGNPHGVRSACTGQGDLCGGTCDGIVTASCAYPGSSTSCRSASCPSGVATLSAGCNGAGACPAVQTQTCGASGCSGSQCAGNCTTDPDCAVGTFCSGGLCQPKLPNGATSGSANQCQSGFAVDGVCCNSACTDTCAACDVAGAVGICSPVTGMPHAGRPACVSDGTACAGQCDGVSATACAYPGSSTTCRVETCADGTTTLAAQCDGTGLCPPEISSSCGGYACSGTSCALSCGGDSDCASGVPCETGLCRPVNAFLDESIQVSGFGLRGCAVAADGSTSAGFLLLALSGLAVILRRRSRASIQN
ncbi:MAG: hypothetical protein HYY84_02615 [Deltaproteobacteria bacterium]|nr:hypothetical protein [Deltaproteobacteria bacterium]